MARMCPNVDSSPQSKNIPIQQPNTYNKTAESLQLEKINQFSPIGINQKTLKRRIPPSTSSKNPSIRLDLTDTVISQENPKTIKPTHPNEKAKMIALLNLLLKTTKRNLTI